MIYDERHLAILRVKASKKGTSSLSCGSFLLLYVFKNKYSTDFSVHPTQEGIVSEISDCKSESVGCWDDEADSLEAELREIQELESHLLYDEFSDNYKVE